MVLISAFTVVPGKTVALNAPADIRLSQAALNDVLVDQKRSSLKLTYWSGLDPDSTDDDEEEEEVDLEREEKKYAINIANFIPGTVGVSISSVKVKKLIFPSVDVHFFSSNIKNKQVETQSFGGLIINSGERVTFEATGKKYDTSLYYSSALLHTFSFICHVETLHSTIHISGNVIRACLHTCTNPSSSARVGLTISSIGSINGRFHIYAYV